MKVRNSEEDIRIDSSNLQKNLFTWLRLNHHLINVVKVLKDMS